MQKKPDDWNNEEDGKWEAPLIENPVCQTIGCGEWKRRLMKNPLYKGKWAPRKIKNPEYKGPWSAKRILNPNYYEEKNPLGNLPNIGAIAFDLWTMAKDTFFDNILITNSEKVADEYSSATWHHKFEVERDLSAKAEEAAAAATASKAPFDINKIFAQLQEIAKEYPIPIIVTALAILITIPYLLYQCCGFCCARNKGKDEEEEEEEEENKNKKKEIKKLDTEKIKNEEKKETSTPTKANNVEKLDTEKKVESSEQKTPTNSTPTKKKRGRKARNSI